MLSLLATPTIPSNWLHRLLLGLLLALFVALGSLYTWVIPLYDGPDEYAHFRYISYLVQEKQLPQLDATTASISHQLIQQPPFYYGLTALLVGWLPVDVALANALPNPYLEKGLSHRAYLTLPDAPPQSAWAPRGARLVSLLGATLAVLGSWLLVRRLLPQFPWGAYVVAALVGFNPQFLFSAASITNDTWATALPVWALWLALRADESPRPWLRWAGVGALVGLAALTKYSALAVVVPLALVGLLQYHTRGWQAWRYPVQIMGSAALGLSLVAGWWFVRNVWAYGEAIPLMQMVALQPQMAWSAPLTWQDDTLWRSVRWLLRSYWGVFGYSIIAPADYHGVVQNMLLVALVGYLVWPVRSLYDRTQGYAKEYGVALLLAAGWFGVTFGSLLNWMRVMRFTDQGRLLFPAAPALAILILLGWRAWMPRRLEIAGAAIAVVLLLGMGVSQVTTLRAAYAMPVALATAPVFDRPVGARFDGGMTLLGIDLPEGAALEPGKSLPLTLFWTTDSVIPENYTLFIHLADRENQLLYHFDGVPYGGRHPTRQWRPGERFADNYLLTLEAEATEVASKLNSDALATLSLGFYPYANPNQRQSATALATGDALGDRILLATVRILGAASANSEPDVYTSAPDARWQKGIELASHTVALDAQGLPHQVTLRWQASQNIHQDYTVFVQVLDGSNQVLAQVDRQPQQGGSPTSTWRRGDRIVDLIDLPPVTESATSENDMGENDADANDHSGWRQVIVGLYDQTGQVLEIVEPAVQGYFILTTSSITE